MQSKCRERISSNPHPLVYPNPSKVSPPGGCQVMFFHHCLVQAAQCCAGLGPSPFAFRLLTVYPSPHCLVLRAFWCPLQSFGFGDRADQALVPYPYSLILISPHPLSLILIPLFLFLYSPTPYPYSLPLPPLGVVVASTAATGLSLFFGCCAGETPSIGFRFSR